MQRNAKKRREKKRKAKKCEEWKRKKELLYIIGHTNSKIMNHLLHMWKLDKI